MQALNPCDSTYLDFAAAVAAAAGVPSLPPVRLRGRYYARTSTVVISHGKPERAGHLFCKIADNVFGGVGRWLRHYVTETSAPDFINKELVRINSSLMQSEISDWKHQLLLPIRR